MLEYVCNLACFFHLSSLASPSSQFLMKHTSSQNLLWPEWPRATTFSRSGRPKHGNSESKALFKRRALDVLI